MGEIEYLADRVALLVDGSIEAVDTVPELVATYTGAVRAVVHLSESVPDAVIEDANSVLSDTARTVYRTEGGELIGVFEDRQRAQDAFTALHEVGTDCPIDLVNSGMEDVFLELVGESADSSSDLE